MAHEDCLGVGLKEWRSSFKPTGTAVFTLESNIEIKENAAGQLKGKHKKTGAGLDNLSCDGTTISFERKETQPDGSTCTVFYQDGKITHVPGKVRIDGTYRKVCHAVVAFKKRAEHVSDETNDADDETGNWQAEKPT